MAYSDSRWDEVTAGRVAPVPSGRCTKHYPLEAEWCPACAATKPAPVVPESSVIAVTVFAGGFDQEGRPWTPNTVFDFIVSALDDADVSSEVNLLRPVPVSNQTGPGSDPLAERTTGGDSFDDYPDPPEPVLDPAVERARDMTALWNAADANRQREFLAILGGK